MIMKKAILLLIIWGSYFILNAQSYIQVDQFGYHTNSTKVAVLNNPQIGFNAGDSYSAPSSLELIDNNTGQVVFTASPTIWNGGATDGPSGDSGWWFDFSSVATPGEYYGMNLSTLYRDFMPNWSYHWGSNNAKASYGNLNLLAAQYGINSVPASQMILRIGFCWS